MHSARRSRSRKPFDLLLNRRSRIAGANTVVIDQPLRAVEKRHRRLRMIPNQSNADDRHLHADVFLDGKLGRNKQGPILRWRWRNRTPCASVNPINGSFSGTKRSQADDDS